MIALAVRRPVGTAMVAFGAALLGGIAWYALPIEVVPRVQLPRLTVVASLPGASPEAVEALVAAPIEAAVRQVRGVRRVTSTSESLRGDGVVTLDAEFAPDTRMNFARLELSEVLAALGRELPSTVRGPFVQPYVPEEMRVDGQGVLRYTITGSRTEDDLRALVDSVVRPALRAVPGVVDVVASPGGVRTLDVELDDRLFASGVRPELVRRAVAGLSPLGEGAPVVVRDTARPLVVDALAESPAEVGDLPLVEPRGRSGRARVMHVRDVATVRGLPAAPAMLYRVDGRPALPFSVVRSPAADALRLADAVRARVASLHGAPGTRILADEDESATLAGALRAVRGRALVSVALVLGSLALLVRSLWLAAAVLSTASLGALVTLAALRAAGSTLDILGVVGLVAGAGMCLDSGIVVLERIRRRRALEDAPAVAAERGAQEVATAVIAGAASSLVVLFPFVYVQGELRVYIVPFAVALAGTRAAGTAAVLTVLPAIAARAGPTAGRAAPHRRGTAVRSALAARLGHVLVVCLSRPRLTAGVAAVGLGTSAWLLVGLVRAQPGWRSWASADDGVSVTISLPPGEGLATADRLARRVEAQLVGAPGVERVTAYAYPQFASVRATFAESLHAGSAAALVRRRLVALANRTGGVELRVSGAGSASRSGGSPVGYTLEVLGFNYETVREVADGLAARLRRHPRVRDVDVNATGRWYVRDGTTEVVVLVDRDQVGLHGLSVAEVVRRLDEAVGDGTVGEARLGDRPYRTAARLAGQADLDASALAELPVAPVERAGPRVRVRDMARVEKRETLSRIVRKDQQYRRLVTYEFRGPLSVGDRLRDAVLAGTHLPAGYAVRADGGPVLGDADRLKLWGIMAVAVGLVFMVTAALFESVRQALCVVLSIPAGLAAAAALLAWTRTGFSHEAHVGLLVAFGTAVNASVLIVDRINQLRRHGASLELAAGQGSIEGARPVLMGGASAASGLIALVLGDSAAGTVWGDVAHPVIGGLIGASLLVPVITSTLYLLAERRAARGARSGRDGFEKAPATV